MLVPSLLATLILAAVHIFGGKLRFLDVIPRSRVLSAAGGVSVAYVFVHLLPELAAGQRELQAADLPVLSFLEHHVYLVALIGLTCFYGLERLIKSHRRRRNRAEESSPGVFWLHIGSFSLYNGLIGYLLVHREDPSLTNLIWYSIAMLLHFLVNDYGLRHDHPRAYHRTGRWLLTAAVLGGWSLGVMTEIAEPALATLFAFVAGGVVLNVLKEELPDERQSRFGAFVLVYRAISGSGSARGVGLVSC